MKDENDLAKWGAVSMFSRRQKQQKEREHGVRERMLERTGDTGPGTGDLKSAFGAVTVLPRQSCKWGAGGSR